MCLAERQHLLPEREDTLRIIFLSRDIPFGVVIVHSHPWLAISPGESSMRRIVPLHRIPGVISSFPLNSVDHIRQIGRVSPLTVFPRGELSSHELAVGLRYPLVVVCLTRDIFVLLYRPLLGQIGHADFLSLIDEQRPGQGTLHEAQ